MFCSNCGTEVAEGMEFCPDCGEKIGAAKKVVYCRNCGEEISENAVVCPKCGAATDKFHENTAQAQPNIVINNNNTNTNVNTNKNTNTNINRNSGGVAYSPKSKIVALVLAILFGTLGIHRFYVGKIGSGILYLFTGGLFCIGWIVDIIKIVTGKFQDKNGLPLKH